MTGKLGRARTRSAFHRGAAAVEFAIILPLVLALVFGVGAAGWMLEQRHDVRADAQDLAREAAINFAATSIPDVDATLAEVCADLDLTDQALLEIELPDGTSTGNRVVVTVTQELEQITGFLGAFFDGKNVSSTATAQLEQDAVFSGVAGQQCDGTVVVTPTPTPIPSPTPTPVPGATPTPTPVATATPVPTATPTPVATCTVPDFDNVRKNNATSLWTGAGFTGSISFQSGSGNYTIHFQTLSASSDESCGAEITVGP